MASTSTRGVRLVPGGLEINGETVPLYSGSIHYFRLDPADWHASLSAAKGMGLRLVDVYVPWSTHEVSAGVFDFGQTDPRRDVAAFLRLAHELGLYAIVRPGPHINAEMTYFGIPERVIWDPRCQARSPRQNPVILPMLPLGFPVPSYGSDAFFDEVARYFHALGPVLSSLLYPDGPIVLLQIDNEGAFYFRDGLYDQDYHPDSVQHYRAHLRDKYKTLQALPAAYASLFARSSGPPAPPPSDSTDTLESSAPPPIPDLRFAMLDPPVRFDATSLDELTVHLDWAEAQENLLVSAFARFRRALEDAGISGLPTMHNFPPGEEATPLSAHAVTRVVDLVGLDYYYRAGNVGRAVVARRTAELAAFCQARSLPPFACEMGAGFPPFFPPLGEPDSIFTILTALAYGLRGMNIYMAVERDRWIGAPIDRRGRPRPFAGFFRKLFAALDKMSFHTLRRRVPVRVVIPRSERRMARALHAFGPLPGTAFAIANAGARERCIEDDLGAGFPIGIEVDSFVRAFEQALEARGVPFALVEAMDGDAPIEDAQWLVCATAGGLSPELAGRLQAASQAGCAVTFGPQKPSRDGSYRLLDTPFSWDSLRPTSGAVPLFVDGAPAAADAAVSRAIDALGLPTFACDPHGVVATVHEDSAGCPRVLFVLNPTDSDLVARVSLFAPDARVAHDLLGGEVIRLDQGSPGISPAGSGPARLASIEVRSPPKTVRMLCLE
jgi:beta-galactosidase